MIARLPFGQQEVEVKLDEPLPIHIPLRHGRQNPNAWYAADPKFEPFRMGDFVGSVKEGGSVNTMDISFNPHGNGTHTECIGHITKEPISVDEQLEQHFHWARVISLKPEAWDGPESEFMKRGDLLLTSDQLDDLEPDKAVTAVILRTLPNSEDKKTKRYTGTQPPYLHPSFTERVRTWGIEHFLLDLPSVDRESDGGKMLAHRAFWYDGDKARTHATITEMVYVPDSVEDGDYLLNLVPGPFQNDAAPSKPVLYRMKSTT